MSEAPNNPLLRDPAIALAREALASDGVGQWLAIYAVARLKETHADPLSALGLPLFHLLLETAPAAPVAVTAVRVSDHRFAHWSVILALADGVCASVDLGAGMGAGQTAPLDLRVEWKGSARVISAEPTAVVVTVTTARGASAHSAEVVSIHDALFAAAPRADAAGWRAAAELVAATRQSAETGARIALGPS